MSNQEISVKKNFIQYGGEFKKVREQLKEEEDKANTLIKNGTKKEIDDLQKAFNAYQKKIDSIVKSKEFKNIEQKAGNLSKEMNKTVLKAQKEFLKVSDQINKKEDWNDAKKQKKVKELYDYVIGKFYTKDEIEAFEKMMTGLVVFKK
tara:strand:+ start:406 stop:849 length:444 start_codon:yes stop_codon:yes gene_type:complete